MFCRSHTSRASGDSAAGSWAGKGNCLCIVPLMSSTGPQLSPNNRGIYAFSLESIKAKLNNQAYSQAKTVNGYGRTRSFLCSNS